LITCPNCGNPVREGQQFCGSCGTDVQAALAAAAAAPAAPAAEEPAGTPYAYSQPPTAGYGYDYQPPLKSSGGNSRLIIIGAAIILVACCMFACGLVFGFEIIPDILGVGAGAATPKATPTPVGLLHVVQYLTTVISVIG
jgi:uncharacterized membrane protein YvbJ